MHDELPSPSHAPGAAEKTDGDVHHHELTRPPIRRERSRSGGSAARNEVMMSRLPCIRFEARACEYKKHSTALIKLSQGMTPNANLDIYGKPHKPQHITMHLVEICFKHLVQHCIFSFEARV